MKPLLLLFAVIHFTWNINAQNAAGMPGSRIFLSDLFTTKYDPTPTGGFEGSVFLTDDWLLARVVFNEDRWIDSLQVRLNIFSNKLHYKNEEGIELQSSSSVNQVRIIQQGSPYTGKVFFLNLPGDKNSFFEVLACGKTICVLKKLVKNKSEVHMYGGEVKKEIKIDTELLFWSEEKFFKTSKDCHDLPASIRDDAAIKKFIEENKLKCNREADMIRLAAFINNRE